MKPFLLSIACAFVACGQAPVVTEVADSFGGNTTTLSERVPTGPFDRTNCIVNDVEVSHEEFLAAQASIEKYNYAERERGILPEDTALVLAESANSILTFEELMEDVWLGEWTEAGVRSVVFSAGDACWTIIHGDTIVIETCGLMLSHDNVLAGIWKEWGAGDDELPAYIYIHRIGDGQVKIFQTTPAWSPTGRENSLFWGADGWFYIEGVIPNTNHYVWHKIKILQ